MNQAARIDVRAKNRCVSLLRHETVRMYLTIRVIDLHTSIVPDMLDKTTNRYLDSSSFSCSAFTPPRVPVAEALTTVPGTPSAATNVDMSDEDTIEDMISKRRREKV